MMTQHILFLAARSQQPRRFLLAPTGFPPVVPGSREPVRADRMPGEGVEDHAMIGGVEQTALLELALNLDKAVAELAQQPDARRLVIHKGAAAAVGADEAAQHDRFAIAVEPGLSQDGICGVVA